MSKSCYFKNVLGWMPVCPDKECKDCEWYMGEKRMIDADELRKELGFSDTCDNCERVTSNCASDKCYSLYDFCVKLDCAIEAILERHKEHI